MTPIEHFQTPTNLALETATHNSMKTEDAYNLISYEELVNAIENDSKANAFKLSAEFLMSAVTNWPTLNLQEPKDLIEELSHEINENLTFDNLNNYLNGLKPHKDAWKIEAVAALLEMFDFDRKGFHDKSITLEMIIEKLTQHYRQR